jgi:probable F420-dependent oxidoreductase
VKFDVSVHPSSLGEVPGLARAAEEMGLDALWTSETQHDPLLPLALAAEHTQKIQLGTAIVVAFARSPGALAYTAWDLADTSGGRFILGLGTQVRAHIARRFGMPWPKSPVGKLRELIAALRSFWRTWQEGEPLNVRGTYYKLTLMTPFFNPGPIEHPQIPIYIAGVNTGLCRLAGESADGFLVHPYHSERYLREVVQPAISQGAAGAGRETAEVAKVVTAFVVTEPDEAPFAKAQLAFYASTPSYRPVMELHGWGEVADRLRGLVRRGGWDEMAALISDEMLETFAVVAQPEQLASALKERYEGLADRLMLYLPFALGKQEHFWRRLAAQMKDAP